MKRSRKWYLIAGGLLVGIVLFVALFAPYLTRVSPDYWDAKTSVLLGTPPFDPSSAHPLGTDDFGRDIWSRIAFGARWSLLFALLIMGARLAVALPMAILGAYGPKRAGWLIDRLYVMTSAIPSLLIYLLLLSHPQIRLIGMWPSVILTVALLTLLEWPRLAVTIKARINQLNAEPFVEGAIAAGGNQWHIFRIHLLPHLWPTLLQLATGELARGLLVIAQLGIFGIFVGGGVLVIVDNGRGADRWIVTTGVPEWGTMLSEGRTYILSKPWIPLAPAFAFLTGVVGFNLLAQGLELLVVSVERLREATTGRLSRRWRWALVAVPVLGVLWYYQGLPWTQEQEIRDLALYQAQRLSAGDLDGYLRTVDQSNATGAADFKRWAAGLTKDPFESIAVTPTDVQVRGAKAKVLFTVSVGYRNAPPRTAYRQTELVRRWGRWYETGPKFHHMRGFYTDTDAMFDPVDPTPAAVQLRTNVQYLETSADHAFERVLAFFPGAKELPRPQVRLYPSQAVFLDAVGPDVPRAATVWYAKGEPIRVSTEYMRGLKRWDIERTLSYEMFKWVAEKSGENAINPVLLGLFEQATADNGKFQLDYEKLAGMPLVDLEDLFTVELDELPVSRQELFAAQSALLVDFLKEKLPEAEVRGGEKGWELPALAERLGAQVPALATAYNEYVYQRLAAESLLTIPAARARMPEALVETLGARAAAAVAGDADKLVSATEAGYTDAWLKWLTAAQTAGLEQYTATLLDYDANSDQTYVLERLTLRGGRTLTAVVLQRWSQKGGQWVVGPVASPLSP